MNLVLGLLLAIGAVAHVSADSNCTVEEQLACLKYRPNILRPFMKTEKEMDEFCRIFPEEIKCLEAFRTRCSLETSVFMEYDAMNQTFKAICMNQYLGNLPTKLLYLESINCINKGIPHLGLVCRLKPVGTFKDRCEDFRRYALCAEHFMVHVCGGETAEIFVDIFKMTYSVLKPENCTIKFKSTIM